MAPDELRDIGHHLLRGVFSYILGRRVDLVCRSHRQSSDSLATGKTRRAIMNGGRRIRQYTSRSATILINGVGGGLGDCLSLVLRLGCEVDDGGVGGFYDV